MAEESMEESKEEYMANVLSSSGLIARSTLCLPNFAQNIVTHHGDEGFSELLQRHFEVNENNAAEQLVDLKKTLSSASTYDFWTVLMNEMCKITGANVGFVAKRLLVDDQNTVVEMPPLGEPGSCLMGVAFYLNDGKGYENMLRDYQYTAYGAPCAYMKHDKVFVVPERLTELFPDNPNKFPWEICDSYLGVPLFADGKCCGHFGMIWSDEGAKKRKLSWGFLEMFMHSLEDMVLQRMLEGRSFVRENPETQEKAERMIPLDAITAAQSLKPYARSLSHELRTPMQGVVGMLDIMYSAVVEGIDTQKSEKVRAVFRELKENIEQAQGKHKSTRHGDGKLIIGADSSKRAVEAADNVVHAYDLNMQMPETPLPTDDEEEARSARLRMNSLGSISTPSTGTKRRRSDEIDFHPGPPLKRLAQSTEAHIIQKYELPEDRERLFAQPEWTSETSATDFALSTQNSNSSSTINSTNRLQLPSTPSYALSPTHRHIHTRDFIKNLVCKALNAGHPVRKIHTPNLLGERIEVRTIGSSDEIQDKVVDLIVETDVPETIISDESILEMAIHKVVDNAVKFTEQGHITITVRLAKNLVEVRVLDTGCGITSEAQANLFKPFSQQDGSLTRRKEGLGMGLFVAKARIREKLGGDMSIVWSATEGPQRGTEFLIRLPISAPIEGSTTPPLVGTPTPSRQLHDRSSPQKSASVPSRGPSCDDRTRQRLSAETPSTAIASSLAHIAMDTPTRVRPQSPRKANRKGFNSNLGHKYPMNILIAEDNAINRKILGAAIRKLGYPDSSVSFAINGGEAVEKYQASLATSNPVDMILMDLWMPVLDGYEATKKIFKIAEKSGFEVAISAVTADITSISQERAREVGMEGFMVKPFKVTNVENLILEHFRRKEQHT
jgi:signal transduction histidine kinase/AmiR/NasT family two-component response regulator